MHAFLQKAGRVLFVVYMLGVHLALLYFIGERVIQRYIAIQPTDERAVSDPTARSPIPTPLPVPESFADPDNTNVNAIASPEVIASPGLMIPVVGVRPEQLLDTFADARSEGRSHDAIDIAAPAGTPVIAASDGELVKFFDSERGGITIYQLTADKRFVLYYAHLQRRADGLTVGSTVKKGTTIGYVGDTGNAGAGNYHLHFSVAIVSDPKRIWDGININPYPFLRYGEYPR